MVVEAIEKIKQIEKEGEEKINAAKVEAERIIQQAEIKAQEIIRQAKRETENELKRKTEIEEKTAQVEIEKIKNHYLEGSKKIREQAQHNFTRAVEIIFKEL